MELAQPAPTPLYRQIKDMIAGRIASGEWPEAHRVPSESELVRDLRISRMTVNRALRELTAEGMLVRIQGVGTFVRAGKPRLDLLRIRNIAEEIRERGHRHDCDVHLLRRERASKEVSAALAMPARDPVFHCVLIHRENGVPVQLEDRHVNPAAAPDFLSLDFTRTTPNAYLMRVAPLPEAEHVVEAILPDAATQRLLEISATEPCLLLCRRTWTQRLQVSLARLIHPGSRYRLSGRVTPE